MSERMSLPSEEEETLPMRARPAVVLLLGSFLTSFGAGGCGWISDLGVPQEIRDKGLLTALEEPMPLDQPFDPGFSAFQVEHPSEMRALLARMEEFAEGLEDPALRTAYAKSLASGEPSRAKAFYALYLNQGGGLSESEKQRPLWERIDDALAEGSEPELVEERLIALAAFVRHSDPGAASRLTEAIRDGWNPESGEWSSVFASIENPSDSLWSDAWAAASQKDLDNALGHALLDRLSGNAPLHTGHPFATPGGTKVLARLMRESQDPRELHNVLGQFQNLDEETGEALWQAAKERPLGLVRLEAAFEWFRRSGSQEALDTLKQAVADERYAVAALNGLSRAGQSEEVDLPTGEALARAKAHFAVALNYRFIDAESEQVTLTPLVSGQAKLGRDEMEVSLFGFAVPAGSFAPGSPAADGIAIVDERLELMPDETPLPDPAANGPYPQPPSAETGMEAGVEQTSLDLVCERIKLEELHDQGCVTALDLVAAFHPNSRRAGILDMFEVYGRYDELKQRMLDSDERWKAFDVPLEDLGFAFDTDRTKKETLPVDESR